jgi:hypothetical protein
MLLDSHLTYDKHIQALSYSCVIIIIIIIII